MPFTIKDRKFFKKYKLIWKKVKEIIGNDFDK